MTLLAPLLASLPPQVTHTVTHRHPPSLTSLTVTPRVTPTSLPRVTPMSLLLLKVMVRNRVGIGVRGVVKLGDLL